MSLPWMEKLGIKQLNEFQKLALEALTESEQNVILKAPTGSGKTELMILFMLSSNKKSIYVSPLRALAYQVYERIHSIFEDVAYITGENYEDIPDEIHNKIVISTYEKIDSALRHNYAWLNEYDNLIIDEIHNISQRPAIEILGTFFKHRKKRIIGMSATLDTENLARWLNAKVVEYKKRAVPLYYYVFYKNKVFNTSPYKFDDPIDFAVKHEKPVLVFARSRREAQILAYQLFDKYGSKVTVFHGGLSQEARHRILKEIENKSKLIVVSTTALGQGVNLPIWMIYFKNMELPLTAGNKFVGWRPLEKNEFDQIAGRAGRPRFDREGIVVIEAESEQDMEHKIRYYINGVNEKLRSSLRLEDLVLVALTQADMTKAELVNVVKETFGVKEDRLDQVLENYIGSGLVNTDGKRYMLTDLGRTIAEAYLDGESAAYYLKNIKVIKDPLLLVANSPAMQGIRVKNAYAVLKRWISGEPTSKIKEDLDVDTMDFQNLLATAAWQAFALYRISEIVGENNLLDFYLSVKFGCPKEAFTLLPLTGREAAAELVKKGVKTKDELCADPNLALQYVSPDRFEKLCLSHKML
ncbi:putative helicase [Los Azufres archaeal virus 1]|nr:putative helicase [Los Azufres archaeal virus 1]